MSITYGKQTPTSYTDPEVIAIRQCITRMGKTTVPGACLVDSFPILRYFPGYTSELRRWREEERGLFEGMVQQAKGRIASGEAGPCLAQYLLENQQALKLSDVELAYLAGAMFGAGSDTTAPAISIMIMAAACFPEAQARVQDELDAVIGRHQAPTFSDRPSLPQVSAFVLECLRWRTVTPGGMAHAATHDIVITQDVNGNGPYRIPAGATVVGDIWSISQDPDAYPDPLKFDPQRWIDARGELCEADPSVGTSKPVPSFTSGNDSQLGATGAQPQPRFFTWGFGRRVCPGREVASRSLYINAALLLWAFRITQIEGKEIDTMAFSDGAIVHPNPFEVKFEPRVSDEGIRRALSETE